MKFSFFGAITLVVILLGWGAYAFWGNKTEIKNYPSKNTAIVAFGDSLIEGVGATKGSDLVSLLAQKTGKEIINLGVSGNTTEQGLARIKEVTDLKPKLTIVLLGGNDYLRKIPEEQTFKNLEQIIAQIQSTGSTVLLLGVRGGLLSDRYEEQYKMLAQKTGSVYVSNVLDGLIGDKRYMSDAVHPNNVGYQKIADRVLPELENLLK